VCRFGHRVITSSKCDLYIGDHVDAMENLVGSKMNGMSRSSQGTGEIEVGDTVSGVSVGDENLFE